MESSDHANHRAKLIETLQLAYSGELAAGYAYRGHWQVGEMLESSALGQQSARDTITFVPG
jgi:hypothetical protein